MIVIETTTIIFVSKLNFYDSLEQKRPSEVLTRLRGFLCRNSESNIPWVPTKCSFISFLRKQYVPKKKKNVNIYVH